jgi:hypothetical protein
MAKSDIIMLNDDDRHYISLLQENINRMAGNSANCKGWLLTLVSAITALQLTAADLRGILWIAPVLIVLFYYLDSYYLGLERKFIKLEGDFVRKAKANITGNPTDGLYCFNINSVTDKRATTWRAMGSESTLPFYLVLLLIVLVICLWPVITGCINCNA